MEIELLPVMASEGYYRWNNNKRPVTRVMFMSLRHASCGEVIF